MIKRDKKSGIRQRMLQGMPMIVEVQKPDGNGGHNPSDGGPGVGLTVPPPGVAVFVGLMIIPVPVAVGLTAVLVGVPFPGFGVLVLGNGVTVPFPVPGVGVPVLPLGVMTIVPLTVSVGAAEPEHVPTGLIAVIVTVVAEVTLGAVKVPLIVPSPPEVA